MRRALMSVCAVVAATAVVTTGCTGGDGDDGRTGGPRSRPAALTWQQELRVADAQQRLVKQCMNRRGFTFWEDRGLTLDESRPVRFVQDDVAWARTHGYGGRIEAKGQALHARNPVAAYRQGLPADRRAAFDAALDGGADARVLTVALPGGGKIRKRLGGCMEEAERTLYGDPAAWFRAGKVVTGLNALYGDRLMRDRRLSSTVRAWSRCMQRAGLTYEDPRAARDAVRGNAGRLEPARSDEAFAAERRVAVADAVCARQTSLRAVASARETYYLERLRDRYGQEIDTYRHLGQRAYDRAVRIVPERR
ncbi:hypothetical protein ACH4C6_29070 [Streptomyces sp. NPDC017943]|uniref:hypothetical protein n=1 Tax=Streptomyces sp. NPDC017943 TaxID=3365019 RepID=UPI0037AB7039